MTEYAAVDKLSSTPEESDYIQAELMPEMELTAPTMADYGQGESGLATLEPTLEATDSFEFNFIDSPVPQSQEPEVAEEILTRLLTPWSLAGLLMLVAANGLLTVYGFTAKAPPTAIAIANIDGLPPVLPSLPPVSDASSSLRLQKLSEIAMPQEPKQSNAANSPVAIAPNNVNKLPPAQPNIPPPPTVIIPPPQPVPMTGYSPYLQAPGYGATAPGSIQPPRPTQSPQNLPTITIQPIHQPQAAAPLPPPPPPPVNNPGHMPPPPPSAVNDAPSMASNGNNVESQMYQQLPSSTQTTAVAPSNNSPQSFNQQTGQQLTRNYNQRTGNGNAGANLATQQLVQELESLNQAPY